MEPSQRAQAIIDTNKHDNGHQYSVERKAALDAWGGYVQADEVANAIEAAKAAGADGLNILASPLWHSELPNIVKQAAGAAPACDLPVAGHCRAGRACPRILPIFRDSSRQLAMLLKGAKPADVPVEQPSKFELVVNLKAAESLGLTLSRSFLIRTDRVVE